MAGDVRDWAVKFSEASDRDPTIGAMARYFSCTYMLDMEHQRVIVEMIDGKA
jgi:phytoene dehydrogenase-like protein